MADYQKFTVITSTGARGYVLRKARFLDRAEQNKVVLDDGQELMVPSEALRIQNDGTFRLDDGRAPSESREHDIVAPAVARQYEAAPAARMDPTDVRETGLQAPTEASTRPSAAGSLERQFDAPPAARMDEADVRATGVQAPTGAVVHGGNGASGRDAREIVVDEHLFADEVAVERVPINQIVDQVPDTRQEGDVLIVPVVEEVLVVQKRLLLKEEVRIQRRRNEVREPRRIMISGNETRIVGSDGREINVDR